MRRAMIGKKSGPGSKGAAGYKRGVRSAVFAVCLAAVTMLGLLVPMVVGPAQAEAGTMYMRGVWVSCFEYGDIGLTAEESESSFRANADRLFGNIQSNGCNAVFFHVRSFDDAIYPSSVTGWSGRFLSGASAPSYDPLKILIESAHKYGLKFHAWMNPYRVTFSKTLDPGSEETVKRIVKQVREILNHYAVDGIHFDDYFYTSEKKYKKVSAEERAENVNKMVHKVHKAAKNKGKLFGISPAGDFSYCREIGADIGTWMSETGYVDYIVPQIYWSDEYKMNGKMTKLFEERLAGWQSINQRDVPMYIGLAAYKAGEKVKKDLGWRNSSNNLSKQLDQMRGANVEGYVLFCYSDLYRSGAQKEIKNFLANISEIRLNHKRVKRKTGKKFTLRVSVWPSRIKDKLKIWSGNNKIASVASNGAVTAKRQGKVRIYVSYGNRKKSCLLVVKK